MAHKSTGSRSPISSAASPVPAGRSRYTARLGANTASTPNSSASVAAMISFCTSPYSRRPTPPSTVPVDTTSGSQSARTRSAACSRPASPSRRARTTVSRPGAANPVPSGPRPGGPRRSPARTSARPRTSAMSPGRSTAGAWSGSGATTRRPVIRAVCSVTPPSAAYRPRVTRSRGRTCPADSRRYATFSPPGPRRTAKNVPAAWPVPGPASAVGERKRVTASRRAGTPAPVMAEPK